MIKVLSSWSGGKDSCFALMQAVQLGYEPVALLNVMNEQGHISRSHGLPASILRQQAVQLRIPLVTVASSWQEYEQHFTSALRSIRLQYGAQAAVFGDIDLQAHRDWEEKVCAAARLEAVLPLWQQDRKQLVHEMLDAGIRCRIVSCNAAMGQSFLGRIMDDALIADLEAIGVDVCGENGEFHTVVTDCPLFAAPLRLPGSYKVCHDNYWFLQWE